jgi:hypothetical protein
LIQLLSVTGATGALLNSAGTFLRVLMLGDRRLVGFCAASQDGVASAARLGS